MSISYLVYGIYEPNPNFILDKEILEEYNLNIFVKQLNPIDQFYYGIKIDLSLYPSGHILVLYPTHQIKEKVDLFYEFIKVYYEEHDLIIPELAKYNTLIETEFDIHDFQLKQLSRKKRSVNIESMMHQLKL